MKARAWLGSVIFGVVVLSSCDFRHDKISSGLESRGDWYFKVRDQVLVPQCISCHGTSGGINLETYEGIRANLAAIKQAAILDRSMPKGGQLNDEQYSILAKWIEAGAPLDSSSGPQPSPSPVPLEPTYASISRQIFEVRCTSCHRDGGQGKNVPLEPLQALLDSPRDLVLPGNPDESGLVIAVTRQDQKRMPPPESGSALTPEQIAVIQKWIQNGARP